MMRRCFFPHALIFLLAITTFLVAACGRERESITVFPTPTPLRGAVVVVPESPLAQPDSPLEIPTATPTWTPAPTLTPEPGATATPTPSPTWTPWPMPTPTPTSWMDLFPESPLSLSSGEESSITMRAAALTAREYLAKREGVNPDMIYGDGWGQMQLLGLGREFLSVHLQIEGSTIQSGFPVPVDMVTGEVVEVEDIQRLQEDDAAAYGERCGRMDPQLCQAVAQADEGGSFDVQIWVGDAQGASIFDVIAERLGELYPDYAATGVETHEITRAKERILDEENSKYMRPILEWLNAEGVAAAPMAGIPSVGARLTTEQLRRASAIEDVSTIYYMGRAIVEEGAANLAPEPTPTQISESPLLDARPLGLSGLPGDRRTEPVWPLLMPDGRSMALSQVDAEDRALAWVAQTSGLTRDQLSVAAEQVMYFSQLGRDMMRIEIAHPALADRWPYTWDYHLFVDLKTGEVFDEDVEGNPFVMYGSESPFGKYDSGLYNALLQVNGDVKLPITLFTPNDVGPNASDRAFRRMLERHPELQALMPARFEPWLLDSQLQQEYQEEYGELVQEEEALALLPLRLVLESLGARIEPTGPSMPVWPRAISAWMTREQVQTAAQSPAVAQMLYAGWPDPNYVPPSPTPLPQSWVEIPFAHVAAFSGDIAISEAISATIITSAQQIEALAQEYNYIRPEIVARMDFQASFYIFLTRGNTESSCLPVDITKLTQIGSVLRVYVDNWVTSAAMACPAVVTWANDLVQVDRSAAGVDPTNMTIELMTTEREGSPSWGRP